MAFVEQASGWWPSFTEVGAKGAEEALVGTAIWAVRNTPLMMGPG